MSGIIELSSLKVLGGRVAVKRANKETKTSGGILLPNNAGEKPMVGEIVAVGTGEKDKDGNVKPITDVVCGNHVLFQKWGGTEIKTDQGDVVIMNVSDLLAVVKVKE